jgi:hypothetical protein
MGGQICVGIRYADKDGAISELALERGTNDSFWRVQRGDFLEQGTEVAEYINDSEKQQALSLSEYGILLLDFIDRASICYNDYASLDRLTFFTMSTAFMEYVPILQYHIDHKSLVKITGLLTKSEVPLKECVEKVNHYLSWLQNRKGSGDWWKEERDHDPGAYILSLNLDSWFKSEGDGDRRGAAKAARAFLKRHHWNLKMRGR